MSVAAAPRASVAAIVGKGIARTNDAKSCAAPTATVAAGIAFAPMIDPGNVAAVFADFGLHAAGTQTDAPTTADVGAVSNAAPNGLATAGHSTSNVARSHRS